MEKILVIDDSRMIRMRIRDMLPTHNVEVVEAKDGREGLEMVRSHNPDLIVLDFLLPKLSGWEVYQALQKSPNHRGIPLVIMSGRKEEVTEKIGEPFSGFAFVEKPFEQEQLEHAMRDARHKASAHSVATPQTAPAPASSSNSDLEAEVEQLKARVAKMQGQIDTLNRQLSQLVTFIKKKLN